LCFQLIVLQVQYIRTLQASWRSKSTTLALLLLVCHYQTSDCSIIWHPSRQQGWVTVRTNRQWATRCWQGNLSV